MRNNHKLGVFYMIAAAYVSAILISTVIHALTTRAPEVVR